jgi:hypothetical protein
MGSALDFYMDVMRIVQPSRADRQLTKHYQGWAAEEEAKGKFLDLKREKEAHGSLKGLTKKTNFGLLGLDKQLAPKNNKSFREFVETHPGWSSRRTSASLSQREKDGLGIPIWSRVEVWYTKVSYDPVKGDPEAFAAAVKAKEEKKDALARQRADAAAAAQGYTEGTKHEGGDRVALAVLGKNDSKLKVSNGKVKKKVKAQDPDPDWSA